MIRIDIDMPNDCASCWIRQNIGCKIANESGWLNNKRDDKCPLEEQPTIEAEPVRHGHWIEKDWDDGDYVCSACGHSWVTIEGTPQDNEMNYCPYCGAHMDEVSE